MCPEGELQCGDGECILKVYCLNILLPISMIHFTSQELFCNQKLDCQDRSDENACSVLEDPNRAEVCDLSACVLPDCFCSANCTVAPRVRSGKREVM